MKPALILKELYAMRDQAALLKARTDEMIKKFETPAQKTKLTSLATKSILDKRKAKLLNQKP